MANVVQEALAKLRTMFSNAYSTPTAHIPEFTEEELDYLDNTLAAELKIPSAWVQVAHMGGMSLDQITDPQEVQFLKNLKTLIDSRMTGPLPPTTPVASRLSLSAVTTSDDEKTAVAKQVEYESEPAQEIRPDPTPVSNESEVIPPTEDTVQENGA